jgi:hypothetical protein
VGIGRITVDHDSIRSHNAVVRPMGADSPERAGTPDEAAPVRHLLDSLRALRPPRPDAIAMAPTMTAAARCRSWSSPRR